MFRNLQLLMISALIFNQLFACAHGHAETTNSDHLQRAHVHFDLGLQAEHEHATQHGHEHHDTAKVRSEHSHGHFSRCQSAHQMEACPQCTSGLQSRSDLSGKDLPAKELAAIAKEDPTVPGDGCCLIVPVSNVSGLASSEVKLLDFSVSYAVSTLLDCSLATCQIIQLGVSFCGNRSPLSLFSTTTARLHTICKLQL